MVFFQLESTQSLDLVLINLWVAPQNQPNFFWRRALNLNTADILDWIINPYYQVRVCLLNCRLFNRILISMPLEVTRIFPLFPYSYHNQKCPCKGPRVARAETKVPPVKSYCCKSLRGFYYLLFLISSECWFFLTILQKDVQMWLEKWQYLWNK